MAILEKITKPADLRIIKRELLPNLAQEIRDEMVQTVSQTGGHLASSLGTVELSIALHYVFDAPKDKIIWDVGHQAYAHKLLTGRYDRFRTLRQFGGISGFPNRDESEYDPFSVGHSSTAISAALGFAASRDIKGQDNKVIAVIGDGSMTGGMSFEALQNAGHLATDLLVILNDNEMFISHRIGAFAGYLARILTAGSWKSFEKRVEKLFTRIHFWGSQIIKVLKRFKVLLFPGMLFEEMGFSYVGPVNGHNVYELIDILSGLKKLKGPVLLHVVTKKGKGYPPAESEPTRFHGIGKFNIITGESEKNSGKPGYTQIFSDTLLKLAREDKDIVAITAAMAEGTGLDAFRKEFPKRFFDVGIAEEHAATFAAALAADGLKPVCAIYSTFLQRSLDQMIHDVSLQKLPVVFALDRAGIVGEDGATHHGAFDLSYLRLIPHFTIMAPADENELQNMLYTAFTIPGPVAIRYPRGSGPGVELSKDYQKIAVGKAEIKREGNSVYILAIGNMVYPSIEASKILESKGIHAGVVNIRFLKPFDSKLILSLAEKVKNFIVVEENSMYGGLYSAVCETLSGKPVNILQNSLPDHFVEHGSPKILRDKYNFSAEKIAEKVIKFLK